jgi:hypothetical protein
MISEYTRKRVFGNLVNKIDGTSCLFALLFSPGNRITGCITIC